MFKSFTMNFLFSIAFFLIIPLTPFANEKVLVCELNYGISGENDETDIEFRNLSVIDQRQVFYLDIENQWLAVESQKDFEEGGGKNSKSNFLKTDSTIFSMSYLENNGTLIRKNIIELDRYTGFVKHEFRTSTETIYRTGTCKLSKNKRLF